MARGVKDRAEGCSIGVSRARLVILGVALPGVVAWCVSACGKTGGEIPSALGGGAGAPADEIRVAVALGTELSVVEFTDPSEARVRKLTEHFWSIPALEGWPGSTSWSSDGEIFAWSNDDGSVGAYARGRTALFPAPSPAATLSVHFLDTERVLVHMGYYEAWEPRSGHSEVHSRRAVTSVARGGYVACEADRIWFHAASGESVSWIQTWRYHLDALGEHVAIVVPEAGATGLAPPLVAEIVVPEAEGERVTCGGTSSFVLPWAFGPVQWSASGQVLGAFVFSLEAEDRVLRVGPPPLGASSFEAHAYPDSSNDEDRATWFFVGEDVYFIDYEDQYSEKTVRKRTVEGELVSLGVIEADHTPWQALPRPGRRGGVFAAAVVESRAVALYVFDFEEKLRRLPGEHGYFGEFFVRPQSDGPGVALWTADECEFREPCVNPRTIVWPDPDAASEDFFTLDGDAQWVPGHDALIAVSEQDVLFVETSDPEGGVRLARGDVAVLPPR